MTNETSDVANSDYWSRRHRLAATVDDEQLDEFQRAFCESDAENIRVLAPAGSGKTQSLLWRCKHLHETQQHARFLVVTFTTAARVELSKRLRDERFSGLGSPATTILTLNSYGWKAVRRRYSSPVLVNKNPQKAEWVRRMMVDAERYPAVATALQAKKSVEDAAKLLDRVDSLKNFGFRLDKNWTKMQFLGHCDELERVGLTLQLERRVIEDLERLGVLADARRRALERRIFGSESEPPVNRCADLHDRFFGFATDLFKTMLRAEHFTMDDQKYVALLLLEEALRNEASPERPFTHVLVDEFQDISPLDLNFVRTIARRQGAKVTIVGDDDQAIFEWRGGAPTYLLEPEQEFNRQFTTFVLERNYRCPRNLVAAADRLIKHNKRRHPKRILAMTDDDAEIVLCGSRFGAAAVERVMMEIDRFLARSEKKERIALLSRKKAQLVPYQILLADKEVRFSAADDLRIFLSSAFQELISMLEVRARRDTKDLPAFQVISDTVKLCGKVPSGSGERDLEQFRRALKKGNPQSYEAGHEIIDRVEERLDSEFDYADAVYHLLAARTVAEAIQVISSRFLALQRDFGRGVDDIFYQDPPFFYLGAVASRFECDFGGFLASLERARKAADGLRGESRRSDSDVNRAVEQAYEPIELMTALRAKGKEFDTVVILDANDKVWPSARAEEESEFEAERRLFYVAMTRARKKLVVSWSEVDSDGKKIAPSPYIAEAELTETKGAVSQNPLLFGQSGPSAPLNPDASFSKMAGTSGAIVTIYGER